MRVTILGKSPSWQDAGGACSGYLIQTEQTNLLLDCGNGVFAKLRERIDYTEVDAVVISHMHADHFLDLVPFSYALTYAPKQQPVPVHVWPGTDDPARPELIAPPGATEVLRRVVGAWGNEDLVEGAFDLREYEPDSSVTAGDLTASFHPVPHFIETFAVNVTAPDAGKLTYGADTRPGEEIIKVARDADLLILEATLPRPERTGVRGHLTPAEAAEHAKRAGAKRLVLTHISDELGDDWALDQAREIFEGPLEIAREGATYDL